MVNAIMTLYHGTNAIVRSPDADTDPFNISAGVLQGDTLAPFLFILCLDYVLKTSIDHHNSLGFALQRARNRRRPPSQFLGKLVSKLGQILAKM